ncbi:MAG TPA: hypothetical protein VKG38_14230 [Solirubrobacteraceae bacterium]|nr:hypothetical protein [Solirubrobacteraceae bacterium]
MRFTAWAYAIAAGLLIGFPGVRLSLATAAWLPAQAEKSPHTTASMGGISLRHMAGVIVPEHGPPTGRLR